MTTTQGEHAQTEALYLAACFDDNTSVVGAKRIAAEFRRLDAENKALHAQVAAAPAQPAAPQGVPYAMHQRVEELIEKESELRRVVEIIALGESANPVIDAGDELVALGYWDAGAVAALRASNGQAPAGGTFQQRVQPWMLECFGAEIAADRVERNHRFLEESLELVQALGCTASEAHQLVDYVFDRPVGDPPQEVGGVMVTLAALCLASGLDMHGAGEVELKRISAPELVAKIRAKQAAKPRHSPLPQAPTAQAAPAAFQRALDIRAAQGWKLGCNKVPVLYTDSINGEQVSRDDLWLCTTTALATEAPAAGAVAGPTDATRNAWQQGYAQGVASALPSKVTPDMRRVFREGYREGGFWSDRLDYALEKMLAAAPTPAAQADSQPAPQGETNVQLDTDSNPSAPGQHRDMAGSVALGQPMGHGQDQAAGHSGAQGDKLLTVAERNIRSFLRSAIFKSESDREAALSCVDVLRYAARAQADSVLEDAALLDWQASARVEVSPEYEGPWHAAAFGEDEKPVFLASGNTPREALIAARKQGAKHD